LENKIWKLTLKDSRHKNFSVDVCDSTLDSNGDLVVKYQNGVPGDNEYVSYLIANANGTIAKYGRCGKVTAASGTATLTGLPKDASGKIALEAGTKLYVFNEQDNGEKTDYSSNLIEVGTTSGHDWGEPSYEWAADNSSVTAKRVCKRDSSHVETETVDTTSEVTTQPTCEGKGKTTYTATFEKDAFETQTKTVEDIDALDHDWGDWTVTTAPTCSAEGEEERVCKRDSAHKDTGKVAIDDDAHEWTFAEFTWTGNETDGYTAVAASYVCKHDSGHTTSANASLSEEVTESTCTAPGKTAYTATIAAADSLDGQEHTEAKDAKPTDPKEHDWNAPTYTWADDNSSVTATRVCKRDASHVEHETAEASSSVTKQPTCEEKGETTYTATFENTAFEKQTKTVEDIDALNHDWGEWTVTTAPTCTEEGEETRTCSHDASHTETRAIDALGHDWGEWTQAKAPTCTEEGEETRTCGHDASHTETRAIDALGHDWGEWTVTKEPTTEAEGEQTRTCARCSEVETRAIPKLDPKPVPTPINYRNTEGNGTQWTKGSSATADFTFKRSKNDGETFSHFTGIQVDGKGVASSNYIAESGSVVVKLKPAYLETLAVGEHTITALFDDGNSASAKFTVVAKKSAANGTAPKGNATAKTGDSGALLGFTALCVASLALLGAGKARRERSLPRK
ncbi:MAG: hypothetical protein IJ113_03010, partial [Eggerthellaceae bacterium]|nr:hypothetical protein [Eggerthellaceae bacterium]